MLPVLKQAGVVDSGGQGLVQVLKGAYDALIGKEADYYGSRDELMDKCAYYLTHENERTRIAQAGLERIQKQHTWRHRVAQIITSIWE